MAIRLYEIQISASSSQSSTLMKEDNPKEANSYIKDTSIPPKSFSRPIDEDVDEDEDFF